MGDKTYNGWSNYETWNIKLWIDNEEGLYNEFLEQARELKDSDDAESKLSDSLKKYFNDNMPDLGASCYTDLLNASMSEVDWYEIAEDILSEIKE